jgi:protein tyrosine/serine phosphatase
MEGVPNLHRIAPGLYRSSQPTAAGMKNLESFGIRTVINLRFFNSDEDAARDTRLQLTHVRMLTWHITDEHVIDVMRELRRTENGPFLIHCHHGADRTGLMSALYRVLEQNWSTADALDELVNGGYGFHPIWRNIPRYLRNAHRDRLRDPRASTSEHPGVQPELREPDKAGTGEIVREEMRAARLLAD